MNFWRRVAIAVAISAVQFVVFAQVQNATVSPWAQLPAPADPLELVTEGAQFVQTPQERSAAIDLLLDAQRLSSVRRQPYDLKTSATTYGSLPSDGHWTLEDTSPAAGIYRWSAQGPAYSGTFLFTNRVLLSSDRPDSAVPLRLAQIREAIFFLYPPLGVRQSIRIATGNLNGAEVRCVLVAPALTASPGAAQASMPAGRSYEESEYCVDTRSGLLATYSPVPGLYIHYDYGSAIHFHDSTIPVGFTVSENGRIVIEAKTENVSDPTSANDKMFQPVGLNTIGAGALMGPPIRVWNGGTADSVDLSAQQVVVVHGRVSSDGKLQEAEILSSSDEQLNDEAIARAGKARGLQLNQDQPGATSQSREIILVEIFRPRAPCPQWLAASASAPCRQSN